MRRNLGMDESSSTMVSCSRRRRDRRWAAGATLNQTALTLCTLILSAIAGSGTERNRGRSEYQNPGRAGPRVFPAGTGTCDWGRPIGDAAAKLSGPCPAPASDADGRRDLLWKFPAAPFFRRFASPEQSIAGRLPCQSRKPATILWSGKIHSHGSE